jgi:hypothetical protein
MFLSLQRFKAMINGFDHFLYSKMLNRVIKKGKNWLNIESRCSDTTEMESL